LATAAVAAEGGAYAAASRAGPDAAALPTGAKTPATANATTTQKFVIAR
jgi:hypothetical protein